MAPLAVWGRTPGGRCRRRGSAMGGVRKRGEARWGRDASVAARRRGAAGRGRWWRPATVWCDRCRRRKEEERKAKASGKEVKKIRWVPPFEWGERVPDSGSRSSVKRLIQTFRHSTRVLC
jgi:hypothetical protein